METNRYDRKKREELRRRRRLQVRRQITLLAGAGVLAVAASAVIIARIWQGNRAEDVKVVIASGYEQFLSEVISVDETAEAPDAGSAKETAAMNDTEGAELSGEQGCAFAQWISEQYPEAMRTGLPEAVLDGTFTSDDAYHVLGQTLHVLSDRYQGKLKNADTARKYGIYVKDREIPGTAAGESADSGEKAEDRPVRISVAGDLCLEEDGFVLDKYDEVQDLEQCISPEVLETVRSADIFYLNHEYTVSERGEPLEGKYYTFRAKPERMALLEEMGTDLVSLANNHIYDYGEEAMVDTMDYLKEAGIPYVGGGRDLKEAERPSYFIVNGMKIGFVAASNAEKIHYTPSAGESSAGILEAYDTALFSQVIQKASKECDYLIAYIHWGPEDENQYAAYQTKQGKEFLDSGADIVVGGHPHVLQGIEYIDGKPVVYSMGDFWFNDETKYTGLLNLEISPEGLEKMWFTPCLQTGLTTQYISGAQKQREMYDFLQGLSPNAQIDDEGVITENQRILY